MNDHTKEILLFLDSAIFGYFWATFLVFMWTNQQISGRLVGKLYGWIYRFDVRTRNAIFTWFPFIISALLFSFAVYLIYFIP